MKTFDQRRQCVQEHMKRIRRNRRKAIITVASLGLAVAVLALVLFIPYDTAPPSVEKHRNTPYYDLIQKLNQATFRAPQHSNRFEAFIQDLAPMAPGKGEQATAGMPMASGVPSTGAPNDMAGEYVEVTDNQVAGVTEADIFKRSSAHIYYLRGTTLYVYSIAREDSDLVGTFHLQESQLPDGDSDKLHLFECLEMYLSEDCRTVTVIASVYRASTGTCVEVISLDVSDPASIVEVNRVCMTGDYFSSRVAEGQILIMSRYRLHPDAVDFDDPATFVPQVGTEEKREFVAPEDIECPDVLSHLTYTVIATLDEKNLEVGDTAAVLSYSDQMYVSRDTIYVTRTFTATSEKNADGFITRCDRTQITGIRYADGQLETVGSVTVDGVVKNQYSMDQYEGILRVVTSYYRTSHKETSDGQFSTSVIYDFARNVSLYCIELSDWSVRASVLGFAPDGEAAQSVRFDGDKAYVCTAVVVTFTDPVYFFDLSDLDHITWTDTGTIDGYSTSLIQLGDGYLLGVGYGSGGMLKIEVYQQVDGKVISVCAYEDFASFSEEYKTYYIDRENDLIGLPTVQDGGRKLYLLLHFDGYELKPLLSAAYKGSQDQVRATIIDGWLYLLSEQLHVEQVW